MWFVYADGWIGYGTHVHRAVFRKLITPGQPLEATCRALRARMGTIRHFLRYRLEFRDARGALYYEGEQSAWWVRHRED